MIFFIIFCKILVLALAATEVPEQNIQNAYDKNRELILDTEEKISIGGTLILNTKEQQANNILMTYKLKELDYGFQNAGQFPPARNFLEAIHDIEKSKIFSLIQRMPKGAVLHGHEEALLSIDFVIKNLTYMDKLYAKFDADDNLEALRFLEKPNEDWESVEELRKLVGDDFDDWLKTQLSFTKDDIGKDADSLWQRFEDFFDATSYLFTYETAYRVYFHQILLEFYEDHVTYIEFRSGFPHVYRLDGTFLNETQVCQLYEEILENFKRENPTFFGAKFIYTVPRSADEDTFKGYLRIYKDLKKAFPHLIAGFDLASHEDLGKPLVEFSSELLKVQKDMQFYFHAAETNWNGFSTDENLIDAVLLGTKRIGHGYALTKHPVVAKIVKERNIGIEVNPISNQVLGLVKDLRNHPGTTLLREGYPVVISSDDPGFWSAKGVSYDWYEVFMGLAARWQDIRLLKQLAINSIQQTSLDRAQKAKLLEEWNQSWDLFIDEINNETCIH